MRGRCLAALIGAAWICICSPAAAVAGIQVFATSYDMPNGGGHASGGSFNYWDLGYTGSGSTVTDGDALAGGLGDLTDGMIATDFWYNTENDAGTGPYVGWYGPGTGQLNPSVTFHFAGGPSIDQIVVHLDHSNVGGVFAPENILVDGNSVGYVAPVFAGLYAIDLSGLNLSGNQHTIQFFQADGGLDWVFVSEIQFFQTAAVPEPASGCVLLLGLVGVVLGRRRCLTRATT